ncbi:isoleucine--tRNA ligase [Cucumis melo var. makuwa]|uniref:Isoleucine--tRNA ligase n=1 Tax=Cucumis melo var. makuwa TaxID=1194695 RepID=A0A5D3B9F8_CUCMM|nr:isoleucine--tRNA ligase [Cucumis melo var. makuwa]
MDSASSSVLKINSQKMFYKLIVLSTALFRKPAFRNLTCNNFVLAEDETLRLKKKGVFGVVRDVLFLPWYNVYRFLVQNDKRLKIVGFAPFSFVDTDCIRLRTFD